MPIRYYAKYITPAILFFFLCVCLGYWTHKLRRPTTITPPPVSAPSPTGSAPVSAPTQK